jgi:hypothetical protein
MHYDDHQPSDCHHKTLLGGTGQDLQWGGVIRLHIRRLLLYLQKCLAMPLAEPLAVTVMVMATWLTAASRQGIWNRVMVVAFIMALWQTKWMVLPRL